MNPMHSAFFVVLLLAGAVFSQGMGSTVEVITVYSQNGNYFLKSTPYDNEFPSLRGVTKVFEKGKTEPLYSFERGFDSVEDDSNNLILSNDGEIIFFLISYGADEDTDGLKSISIYKHGRLRKSYTASEITGCDLSKERCELVYGNYDEVVDKEKSNWGTGVYKKVFKPGVNAEERFLSDFPLFATDETIYLTDSKRNTHSFSLSTGERTDSEPFTIIYPRIRAKAKNARVVLQRHDAPHYFDFPKLKNGKPTEATLAAFLGMKPLDIYDQKQRIFRRYSVQLTGVIARDGTFEPEELEIDDGLPKEKVMEFFRVNRFDLSAVPAVFPKWRIGPEVFFFRNKDDVQAKAERLIQAQEEQEDLKKRWVAETIRGVYVPADLGDALAQLDKVLPEIDRKEIAALKTRQGMNAYHLGLGTWMRNNWGLWSGSRLSKYFSEKGVFHPEEMSGVILDHYWDWLQGDKTSWKEWEKNPKR